jgi:hypothetical protein
MTARKGAGLEAAATDLEAQKNVGNDNARSSKPQPQNPQAAPKSWRDVLPIHPAAETATGFVVTAPAHFQQAKTDGHTSHFLQIVAKPKRSARKRPEPKPANSICTPPLMSCRPRPNATASSTRSVRTKCRPS